MGLLIVTAFVALTCGQAASLPPGEHCSASDSHMWEANNIVEAESDWQACLTERAAALQKGTYDQVDCFQFDPNDPRSQLFLK